MDSQVVWIECRLEEDGPPIFFPGSNEQHARARARQFIEHYELNTGEITFKKFVARKRIITPRRKKKLRLRRILSCR